MAWTSSRCSLGIACIAIACGCACPNTAVDAGDSGLADVLADSLLGDSDARDVSGDVGGVAAAPWEGPHFVQVVTGSYHSCARTDAGEVYCWGDDLGLQLGEGLVHRHTCGAPLRRGPCRPFAAPVPVLEGAIHIAAHELSTCGLFADGSVACAGQLPVPFPYLPPLTTLTMGAGLVCGTTAGANLVCVDLLSGEVVTEADGVSDVTAADSHHCYIQQGRVWCGGETWYGELGEDADHPCRALGLREECPGGVWVELPVEAIEVEAGTHIACVRTEDDEVYCWGALDEPWTPPTHLPELDGPAVQLVVGRNRVCVLRPSGTLDCRERQPEAAVPRDPMPALEGVVSVELQGGPRTWGGPHACVVTQDGAVSCWGNNGAGELGRGHWATERTDHWAPVVEHIRLQPAPEWTARPLPTPTEIGWIPYPTLNETCTIERAEEPELLGPFSVEPCGVSTCLRAPTDSAAWRVGQTAASPGLGGVVPFRYFTETHRIYGLVSILTGEVLAAVRSPADFFGGGDERRCVVENLEVGASHAVLALGSGAFPLRIVHAPIASLRDVHAPTETGHSNPYGREDIPVGADVFSVSNGWTLEIHAQDATRTHRMYIGRRITAAGSMVLWDDGDRKIWAVDGLSDPVVLLELDTTIRSLAAEPGRVAWLEEDANAVRSLWTAALSEELELMEPISFGVVDASRGDIATGEGFVAYIATDGDLVLRGEADLSERRLANYRWGDIWYIAEGHVVTGGSISSTARTPIEAIPLVTP